MFGLFNLFTFGIAYMLDSSKQSQEKTQAKRNAVYRKDPFYSDYHGNTYDTRTDRKCYTACHTNKDDKDELWTVDIKTGQRLTNCSEHWRRLELEEVKNWEIGRKNKENHQRLLEQDEYATLWMDEVYDKEKNWIIKENSYKKAKKDWKERLTGWMTLFFFADLLLVFAAFHVDSEEDLTLLIVYGISVICGQIIYLFYKNEKKRKVKNYYKEVADEQD